MLDGFSPCAIVLTARHDDDHRLPFLHHDSRAVDHRPRSQARPRHCCGSAKPLPEGLHHSSCSGSASTLWDPLVIPIPCRYRDRHEIRQPLYFHSHPLSGYHGTNNSASKQREAETWMIRLGGSPLIKKDETEVCVGCPGRDRPKSAPIFVPYLCQLGGQNRPF